ncbi:MAG: hypothetical protein AB1455_12425, partial [Pseudomonadota bacterium]
VVATNFHFGTLMPLLRGPNFCKGGVSRVQRRCWWRRPCHLKKYASAFKPIKLFTVEQYFGSLSEAQKVHFNDGGQFDKLYTAGR